MTRPQQDGTPPCDVAQELSDLSKEMENIRLQFNFLTDPDLIESSIYSLNALTSRYNYLIHLAKEQGYSCEYHEYEETQKESRKKRKVK